VYICQFVAIKTREEMSNMSPTLYTLAFDIFIIFMVDLSRAVPGNVWRSAAGVVEMNCLIIELLD